LKSISEQDRQSFYNSWYKKVNDEEYIALISPYISTSSDLPPKSSYGITKEHEKLKQINYQEFNNSDRRYILFSNIKIDPVKVLRISRNYDVIKYLCNILRHFRKNKGIYIHSDTIDENKIFIDFISMILISMMLKVMDRNKFDSNITIDDLLSELSNIKAVIIRNIYIIDPLTKPVKLYLDAFNCPYPG
jgi:hypothetical protein